ncbi:type III-A CRISPR-associated RAMP protein Csm4 [Streptococcus sobrinus]|uniref:type III-A CRISPR-associated RAMP protein Csm4 n=1 Tax=Streptococcus sobrinus TaxID=1310 RepID=UPI0002D4AF36|nr:hypothetical protein [Streptococcus sobrinus]
MTYKLYRLAFGSVHFGNGTLESSTVGFTADRLFSALVLEAIKSNRLEELLGLANAEDFALTDAFPYSHIPYLPKPIGFPSADKYDQTKDVVTMRQEAKKTKKLEYIEYDRLPNFLEGDIIENNNHFVHSAVTKNSPNIDEALFQVGISMPSQVSALYIIASQSEILDDLMTSLQYSGLGGKRTSGYGRFTLAILDLPADLEKRLTLHLSRTVMTLTTCLPVNEALEEAVAGAKYLLKKSSGFAFSQGVKDNYRKQDLYKFKAGSTFTKTFKGQIVDVRPDNFPHPVWNYAKPLFYSLED